MDNIGFLIKFERLDQKMKQINLAKGICTPSYLSKIENKLTIPSEETVQLLLKRLKVENKYHFIEKDSIFLKEAFSLYKNSINYRNEKSIILKIEQFHKNEFSFQDESNFYTFHLIQWRLLSITDHSSNKIPLLIKTLESMKRKFDMYQTFIFNLNYGIYYHLENEFSKALSFLELNLDLIYKFPIEEWELADFYHVLSLSYLSNYQNLNAINYAEQGLKYYKDKFYFERAVDSYITIAIAQKRNRQYRKAEENLNLAKQLAMNLNLKEAIGRINQNLGNLFSLQGDSKAAIKNYKESLENKRDSGSYFIPLLSIVQEYSKNGSISEVIEWCEKGIYEIENSSSNDYQSFYYHFNIYLQLHTENENCVLTLKKAIKYFENRKDFRHVNKYALLLANIYFEKNSYKNAGVYFKKSNDSLFLQKSIKAWEDL